MHRVLDEGNHRIILVRAHEPDNDHTRLGPFVCVLNAGNTFDDSQCSHLTGGFWIYAPGGEGDACD